MDDKNEKKDPFDGEYIGNIWGWRTTFMGLGLILVVAGLAIYRHISLGVPFGETETPEKVEQVEQDSVLQKKQ